MNPETLSNARAGGLSWLMTIVAGIVAMLFLNGIVVPGNAAATAANVLSRESALRLGIIANLFATIAYVAATLYVYALLKPVSRNVSLLAAFFSLLGCVTGAISSAAQLAPIVLLRHSKSLAEPALLAFQWSGEVSRMGFLFFGLHCLLVGVLIVRSTFIPRAVGALMVLAGLCWMTYSLTHLVSPAIGRALVPFIMLPGIAGEMTLTICLLVIGMKVRPALLVPKEG